MALERIHDQGVEQIDNFLVQVEGEGVEMVGTTSRVIHETGAATRCVVSFF